MTDPRERIRAAFRLNLEQQKKLAKELLNAAKAGDSAALARIRRVYTERSVSGIKLTDAQFVIARELGLSSWTDLKAHIASMSGARAAITRAGFAPDHDMKTLHLRCGSDIQTTLREAGFEGDFLEHSYPYCHGPVTATADHFEKEAEFIVQIAGKVMNVSYAEALAGRREEERLLTESMDRYERIVLWMEHDCFDQLVLTRCLALYATARKLPAVELVDIDNFPGTVRFTGLGQLPLEALRLLWERRRSVTPQQLTLANKTWNALIQSDPRPLAALMRGGCTALPHLASALHRLLQELPSVENGTSLTERLTLQVLAEKTVTLNALFAALTYRLDPLPLATDLMLLLIIERMQRLSQPVLTLASGENAWKSELAITTLGRQVLAGEVDLMSLRPLNRWVGSIEIRAEDSVWRWDEKRRDAVLRTP